MEKPKKLNCWCPVCEAPILHEILNVITGKGYSGGVYRVKCPVCSEEHAERTKAGRPLPHKETEHKRGRVPKKPGL